MADKGKPIVIIGAGGFGREIAWLIEDINKESHTWELLGFVDDNPEVQGTIINGYPVLGDVAWLQTQKLSVVCCIANPKIKKNILQKLEGAEIDYPSLIHPSVIMSNTGKIGEGSLICAGSILSVNIEIGKFVLVDWDCTIGHDAQIGDYSTLFPSVNISGHVALEHGVTIGAGTVVIPEIQIGENTIVGAGSVVTKDLPANCTAVGAPAKPIKYHK